MPDAYDSDNLRQSALDNAAEEAAEHGTTAEQLAGEAMERRVDAQVQGEGA